MRVRYGEHTALERRALAEIADRARSLFRRAARAARDDAWWRSAMAAVHPELRAEQWAPDGLLVRGTRRALLPLAEFVGALAPPRWQVTCRRAALPFAEALASVERATRIDFRKALARAGFVRGHLLEITLFLPGGSASERERQAAELLVERLLGERLTDDWVGAVSVAPAPRGGPLRLVDSGPSTTRGFPLAELGDAVSAAVAGVTAELPDQPHHALPDAKWTLFELEPEPAEDFGAKDDLVLATTSVPELLKCQLEAAPFSSLRFSRHAELFFYLKYESTGSLDERLAHRRALEDALEDALVGARAGRVVGNGLGLRYAYVDLALSDVGRGLDLARALARDHALPPRAWLLPFDGDLAEEWLEAGSGSSAPPGI